MRPHRAGDAPAHAETVSEALASRSTIHPLRRAIAIAMIPLAALVIATSVERRDAVAEDAPIDPPDVFADRNAKLLDAEDIFAGFERGDAETRVIVNLQPSVAIETFTSWDSPIALAEHRAEVARVVDDALASLPPGTVDVIRRYDNQASFAGWVTAPGLEFLLASDDVIAVQTDAIVTLDTKQGIPQMAASSARSAYGGSGVSVAIADTGIDYTHPDMGGGGFPNAKVIGGWDFGDDDSNPMDFHGHGTAAAGVAAGDVNNQGDYIGGVAEASRLYALKISFGSGGSAFTSDMIAAWDWAVTHKNDDPAHPILVINTSFSDGQRYTSTCDGATPSQTTAANNAAAAGIALFCSNGNDGYCDGISKPACITSAIGVGAVYDANLGGIGWCVDSASCVRLSSSCSSGWQCNDSSTAQDQVTCYSNSSNAMELLAPSNDARVPNAGGGYTGFGGTSAASPYAAGAAAVLQAAAMANLGSYLSVDDVRTILAQTGDPVLDAKSGITMPRVNLQNAVNALAAPNDSCNTPIEVTDGLTPFTNSGATTDGPDEPTLCNAGGSSQILADVWFCYTAPCDGQVTVSTCDADFDTKIAVYDGCSCPSADSAIACNDDSCATRSVAVFDAIGGNSYLIRVGSGIGAEGSGNLDIACIPANDDCANATAVSVGTIPFSTNNATTDGPDEPSCSIGPDGIESDVWFSFQAGCTGLVTVNLCGSNFDTKVAVYFGTTCPQSEASLDCSDDACGNRSILEFPATAGEEFLIRVGSPDGSQGTGSMLLSCVTSHDDCASAGSLSEGSTSFSTLGATTDGPDEPGACSKSGDTQIGSDIWYVYTPTCTGEATVSLCGADYDTKLAIYAGDDCPMSAAAIACSDDACGSASELTFMAAAGTPFLVRIGGHDGERGSGTIDVSCTPTPIDQCQSQDAVNTLRVNFDNGIGSGHVVMVDGSSTILADIAKPSGGGNGRFVVHLNAGAPTVGTITSLPGNLGDYCFPVLLSDGANPVALWNSLGKEEIIGVSQYFGVPILDPGRAPETFLFLPVGDPVNMPPGSSFTMQAVIVNPAATSPKGASVTNAILVVVE